MKKSKDSRSQSLNNVSFHDMDPNSYEKTKEKRINKNSTSIIKNLARVMKEKSQENFKELIQNGARLSNSEIQNLNQDFKKIYEEIVIQDAKYSNYITKAQKYMIRRVKK